MTREHLTVYTLNHPIYLDCWRRVCSIFKQFLILRALHFGWLLVSVWRPVHAGTQTYGTFSVEQSTVVWNRVFQRSHLTTNIITHCSVFSYLQHTCYRVYVTRAYSRPRVPGRLERRRFSSSIRRACTSRSTSFGLLYNLWVRWCAKQTLTNWTAMWYAPCCMLYHMNACVRYGTIVLSSNTLFSHCARLAADV